MGGVSYKLIDVDIGPAGSTETCAQLEPILAKIFRCIYGTIGLPCRMNTVFWSNTETKSIHRANLNNGSNVEMVVDSGMLYPGALFACMIHNCKFSSVF